MIILELYDGGVEKFNLPNSEKEKALYDLWYKTVNKKIKIKTAEGDTFEITLADISRCLIGKEAENYKEPTYNGELNKDAADFLKGTDVPDFMKDMLFGGKK